MIRSLWVLTFLTCVLSVFAEGSKQLQPLQSDVGNLHLRPGDPDYTPFGLYGAPDVNSIKLTIADTSETLYFGLNNEGENNGRRFVEDVEYRIVSPSGVVVYESIIPDVGEEGNIPTWNAASVGPAELFGAGGYDALTLKFDEIGDYKIEFDPPGNTYTDIHLFDFTVVDSLNTPRPGRLHSQGWQITAESFDNPFNATLFPYHPDGVVYEVDFNAIRPYLFVINFNSTGTDSTGVFLDDRRSKNQNRTYPEFEVFLSPPDENLYPRFKRELTFNANITNKTCDSTEICLSFITNAPGEVEGFIDFNGNGVYDEDSGELYFGGGTDGTEETCIAWDGKDADGNRVDQRQMQMISSFGYGVMHLPIFDAENHENGYRVRVHSPQGLKDPALHWDDRNISNKGTALDGITDLNGCDNPAGCHRWRNRGRDNNNSETINTWWYSEVMYDTLIFDNLWNRPVHLSFDPDSLDQEAKTICAGDSLPFFIYNDFAHFDTTFYTYEWTIGGQTAPEEDVAELIRQINGPVTVGVVSREKEALECYSEDELQVTVVQPIEIEAVIQEKSCIREENLIAVTITQGPPSPVATWEELPGETALTVSSLTTGEYHLRLADEDFSERCALDTAFELVAYEPIEIKELTPENTFCFEAGGKADIEMEDPSKHYAYSWDGGTFQANPFVSGLNAAIHSVSVIEPATGCTADSTFEIEGMSFSFSLITEDEVCDNDEGEIVINLPDEGDFIIYFDGIEDNRTVHENMSEGAYNVRVVSNLGAGCFDQQYAVIENEDRPIPLEEIIATPSDCGAAVGSADFVLTDNGNNYQFAWQGLPFSNQHTYNSLSVGTYSMRIKEVGTLCSLDTTVVIPGDGFTYTASSKNEFCDNKNGSVSVNVNDPGVRIKWNNGEAGFTRNNLRDGIYSFELTNIKDPACYASGQLEVLDEESNVKADFAYFSLVNGEYIGATDVVQFLDQSAGMINSYSWNFGDGTRSTFPSPEHAYSVVGEFNVSLQVTDVYGCKDIIIKPLPVEEKKPCGAALPNAFSPNGDHMNDNIGLLGTAFNVDLRIYNRWGELVYRGYNEQDRWDGTYRGEDSPLGAYPYVLEFTCPNNRGVQEKQKKVGDISLIR